MKRAHKIQKLLHPKKEDEEENDLQAALGAGSLKNKQVRTSLMKEINNTRDGDRDQINDFLRKLMKKNFSP